MAEIPPTKPCTLYVPGHTVHFIQARRSCEEPGEQEHGRIRAIQQGVIAFETATGIRTYRNHETACLRAILVAHGAEAILDGRWQLLKVPHDGGSYYFCVAPASAPWRRCRSDTPSKMDAAALADRALTHGGFLVPGRDVLRSSEE